MAHHEFVVEKRLVILETSRIKVHIVPVLNDYFGKHLYNQDFTEGGSEIKRGKIEQIALFYGVKKLTVGGEEKKIDGARPARSLPDLWGEDEDGVPESIYEMILRRIVADNPWLYKKQPYSAVFALYAPEPEMEEDTDEKGDPTVSAGRMIEESGTKEAGSTNGSTSTIVVGEGQEEEMFEDSEEIIVPHE